MRVFRLLMVVLALASLGAMEVTTQTPLAKLLECMQDNRPQSLKISQLRLEGIDNGSERIIEARYYSRRDRHGFHAMLLLTAPEDLAGTRYLLKESDPDDHLFVYLPALDKVKKLSGVGGDSGIAGTSLKVSDLRLVAQAMNASAIAREGSTFIAGRKAELLRFSPAIADSPFRRARVAVDQKTCVILKAEFDRPEGVARTYRADPASLMQSGRYHYASVASVEDLSSGDRVTILLRGVQAGVSLSSRGFDPQQFHRYTP